MKESPLLAAEDAGHRVFSVRSRVRVGRTCRCAFAGCALSWLLTVGIHELRWLARGKGQAGDTCTDVKAVTRLRRG